MEVENKWIKLSESLAVSLFDKHQSIVPTKCFFFFWVLERFTLGKRKYLMSVSKREFH